MQALHRLEHHMKGSGSAMIETERYTTTKVFEFGDAVVRVHFPEYTDAQRQRIQKTQQNATKALLIHGRRKNEQTH